MLAFHRHPPSEANGLLEDTRKLVERAAEWFGAPLLEAETEDDVEGVIAEALDDPSFLQIVIAIDHKARKLPACEIGDDFFDDLVAIFGERHRPVFERLRALAVDQIATLDLGPRVTDFIEPTDGRSVGELLTSEVIPAELIESVYDLWAGHVVQLAIVAADLAQEPVDADRADHLIDRLARHLDALDLLREHPEGLQPVMVRHFEREVQIWTAAGEALSSKSGTAAPFGPPID